MIINYYDDGSTFFYNSIEQSINKSHEINLNYEKWDYVCIQEKNSIWKQYFFRDKITFDQGFKIHITTNVSQWTETLNVVSNYLFKNKIAFKHLATLEFLKINHSKNENRASSGKFITIYPDPSEFVKTVKELYQLIKDFKNGPYILSDKRYKNSNIFYRYGSFKNIKINDKYVIMKPNGNYIEDQRLPYYIEPDFVVDPFYNENVEDEDYTPLDKYEISEAIKFNNSGGIYNAKNIKTSKYCVIKEARPNIAVDKFGNDAVDRLKREYYFLDKLKNVDGVVKSVEIFKAWEHYFLVTERIDGINLNNFLAGNYPINNIWSKRSLDIYYNKVINIYFQLKEIIKNVHDRGIGIGDLSHNNIMIDTNEKVWLIDFETAGSVNDSNNYLITKGYFLDPEEDNLKRDNYALLRILKFMLYPVSPCDYFDASLNSKQIKHILEIYDGLIDKSIVNDLYKLGNLTDTKNYSLEQISDGLVKTILNTRIEQDYPWPGDVKMFINEYGKYNFINGKYGILFALSKYLSEQEMNNILNGFCKESEKKDIINITANGLMNGKMGIAFVLLELGFNEFAKEIVSSINVNYSDINDISFSSGLAGIGIGYLNFYVNNKEEIYLDKAIEISNYLMQNIQMDENIDFFNGISGVLLFESILFGIIQDRKIHKFIDGIAMYISNKLFFKRDFVGIVSNSKVSPYISDGAIGILYCLKIYQHKTGRNILTIKVEKELKKYTDYDLFYDCGLYQGLMSKVIPIYSSKDKEREKRMIANELSLRLPKINENLYTAGQFSNKLTFDVFSGSAGILLGIYSLLNNKLCIFPIDERL